MGQCALGDIRFLVTDGLDGDDCIRYRYTHVVTQWEESDGTVRHLVFKLTAFQRWYNDEICASHSGTSAQLVGDQIPQREAKTRAHVGHG